MRTLKQKAQAVHRTGLACPREGDCLACRFMEKRLFESIEDGDRSAIWHWTSHAYSEMRQCDLDCPATRGMAQMVVHMYTALPV